MLETALVLKKSVHLSCLLRRAAGKVLHDTAGEQGRRHHHCWRYHHLVVLGVLLGSVSVRIQESKASLASCSVAYLYFHDHCEMLYAAIL